MVLRDGLGFELIQRSLDLCGSQLHRTLLHSMGPAPKRAPDMSDAAGPPTCGGQASSPIRSSRAHRDSLSQFIVKGECTSPLSGFDHGDVPSAHGLPLHAHYRATCALDMSRLSKSAGTAPSLHGLPSTLVDRGH